MSWWNHGCALRISQGLGGGRYISVHNTLYNMYITAGTHFDLALPTG